ncbi:hypothetical protein LCGC14_1650150 [marine sediment metagenome]|uniref:Uncharacterized protein n=1 Tax=marine sediment metagenome TaxID=412755 RepID=A0A0F9IJJ8_9ZZZZ
MTETEKKVQKALGTLPPMSKETERALKAIFQVGGDNWGLTHCGGENWVRDIKNTLARSGRVMTIEKV